MEGFAHLLQWGASGKRCDICHKGSGCTASIISHIEFTQAQTEVRETFLGDFAGQLISAVLWLISAVAYTWKSFFLGNSS
jgi:hypothetical protein